MMSNVVRLYNGLQNTSNEEFDFFCFWLSSFSLYALYTKT